MHTSENWQAPLLFCSCIVYFVGFLKQGKCPSSQKCLQMFL
jgi:hypothetical protein